MSKLVRHVQKRGTALFLALQLTGLILLSLLSFFGGPQSAKKAPAGTQVSAPAQAQTAPAQGQQATSNTDPLQQPAQTADQAFTAKDLTAAEKSALRKTAHFAKKLYEPLNTQVFNLQRSRLESQAAQRSA